MKWHIANFASCYLLKCALGLEVILNMYLFVFINEDIMFLIIMWKVPHAHNLCSFLCLCS